MERKEPLIYRERRVGKKIPAALVRLTEGVGEQQGTRLPRMPRNKPMMADSKGARKMLWSDSLKE